LLSAAALIRSTPEAQVKVDLEFPGREANLLAQIFIACGREDRSQEPQCCSPVPTR